MPRFLFVIVCLGTDGHKKLRPIRMRVCIMTIKSESFISIEFDDMVKWLGINQEAKRVPTLGYRSYIDASAPDAKTIRIIGKKGRIKNIDRNFWCMVCKVIDKTKPELRRFTKNYNQLPNYYFTPSVPALCRAYCEEKKVGVK